MRYKELLEFNEFSVDNDVTKENLLWRLKEFSLRDVKIPVGKMHRFADTTDAISNIELLILDFSNILSLYFRLANEEGIKVVPGANTLLVALDDFRTTMLTIKNKLFRPIESNHNLLIVADRAGEFKLKVDKIVNDLKLEMDSNRSLGFYGGMIEQLIGALSVIVSATDNLERTIRQA